MTKQCQQCTKQFNLTEKDLEFYQRVKTPVPTHCPDCRCQRRLSMRNERTLYQDQCDSCGKKIISLYSPKKPFKVYCYDCFYSDKWNPLNYGRNFDFSRPFFSQFNDLQLQVPRINTSCLANENSDYTNGSGYNKNCYMIFVSDHNEDSLYSYSIFNCRSVLDCLNCYDCELCYECSGCVNCFNCKNLIDCSDNNECQNCFDCKGCTNCFGCVGLRHKEYCIFNKQYSKEDYVRILQAASMPMEAYYNLQKKHHHLYRHGLKNENSSGDYINRCKDSNNCYDSHDLENCQFVINGNKVTDSQDGYMIGDNTELCYEIISALNCHFCKFNYFTFNATDCEYTDSCSKVKNLFGCVGLKNEEFCILNKKYEEKEYYQLKEKIIEHMKKNGEYGEFFPSHQSPFAYNEATAWEFYPLSKEQIIKNKWPYEELDNKSINPSLPVCQVCQKNFNFIPQEIKFYEQQKIKKPQACFNCRHLGRLKLRNPRRLFNRECENCHKKLISTFASQRTEKIYCETCYNKYIY